MKKNRPFLKWAGNKFQCLEKILPELPYAERLIEPFAGSGAVFLNTEYQHYLIAEENNDLILLFNFIKKEGVHFIDECQEFFHPDNNDPSAYYQLRQRFNQCTSLKERAVLFLYLNRHGFNGLCRYNQQGIYNVPFGRYEKIYFPAKELYYFHKKAQQTQFIQADFRVSFSKAKKGDIIYCDPPYIPLSRTAKFTTYTIGKFGYEEQIILAKLAHQYASKGIPVIISNHDTPLTRELYHGALIKSFLVNRQISCHSSTRQPVLELLAIFQ